MLTCGTESNCLFVEIRLKEISIEDRVNNHNCEYNEYFHNKGRTKMRQSCHLADILGIFSRLSDSCEIWIERERTSCEMVFVGFIDIFDLSDHCIYFLRVKCRKQLYDCFSFSLDKPVERDYDTHTESWDDYEDDHHIGHLILLI